MFLKSGRWISSELWKCQAIDKINEGMITVRDLINYLESINKITLTTGERNDVWRGIFQGEGFHINHHTYVTYTVKA